MCSVGSHHQLLWPRLAFPGHSDQIPSVRYTGLSRSTVACVMSRLHLGQAHDGSSFKPVWAALDAETVLDILAWNADFTSSLDDGVWQSQAESW